MTATEDEENRKLQWQEDQRTIAALRLERLAAIAGDEAEVRNNYERWKPIILANAERRNDE